MRAAVLSEVHAPLQVEDIPAPAPKTVAALGLTVTAVTEGTLDRGEIGGRAIVVTDSHA